MTPPAPPALNPAAPRPSAASCANCGAELAGPYCAQCGQHVADYHRSVWRFVADFFDNTFCWDNKLFRTLGPLFGQPGYLTREFMAGRRARYVHPLRLFLFTSAVCLAVLHFGSPGSEKAASTRHRNSAKASKSDVPTPEKSPAADPDEEEEATSRPGPSPISVPASSPLPSPGSASFLSQLADAVGTPTPASTPSAATVAVSAPLHASPSPGATPLNPDDDDALEATINRAIKDKLAAKKIKTPDDIGESLGRQIKAKVAAKGGMDRFSQDLVEGIRQRLSWVSLAMLPIFALLLRALYWREDTFYFLHLVFSLHYHTFLLLFWTAYSWLETLLGGTFLSFWAALLLFTPPLYLFLALRRVYGDSVRRAWAKVILLVGMHLLAIIIGLAAIGALAFFSAVQ